MTDIVIRYYPEWGPPKPVLYPNIFSYSVTDEGVLKMNTVWGQTIPVPLTRVRKWSVHNSPIMVQ